MKAYNPYLKMTYDTKKEELVMTKDTLLMWLTTWEILEDSQKENVKKALNYLTKK